MMPSLEAIDALLPQLQCQQCGYEGCMPYAKALIAGEATNLCQPGGATTQRALERLLPQADNIPLLAKVIPQVANILSHECIGCTKCIRACPVDAIIGTAKQMHDVLTWQCTGCKLCLAACPIDCINLHPHPQWQQAQPEGRQTYLKIRQQMARTQYQQKQRRLATVQSIQPRQNESTQQSQATQSLKEANYNNYQKRLTQLASQSLQTNISLKQQRQIAVNAALHNFQLAEQHWQQIKKQLPDRGKLAQARTRLQQAQRMLILAQQALTNA